MASDVFFLRVRQLGETNSRPNAPEGRRGDLYPAELRARITRIPHFGFLRAQTARGDPFCSLVPSPCPSAVPPSPTGSVPWLPPCRREPPAGPAPACSDSGWTRSKHRVA